MRDLARLQTVSPLAMLASAPLRRPKGPVRLCFDDMPERERPTLLRECLARASVHYDFCAVPDAPFRVDLAINNFPGLMVVMGGLQASRRKNHEPRRWHRGSLFAGRGQGMGGASGGSTVRRADERRFDLNQKQVSARNVSARNVSARNPPPQSRAA